MLRSDLFFRALIALRVCLGPKVKEIDTDLAQRPMFLFRLGSFASLNGALWSGRSLLGANFNRSKRASICSLPDLVAAPLPPRLYFVSRTVNGPRHICRRAGNVTMKVIYVTLQYNVPWEPFQG